MEGCLARSEVSQFLRAQFAGRQARAYSVQLPFLSMQQLQNLDEESKPAQLFLSH